MITPPLWDRLTPAQRQHLFNKSPDLCTDLLRMKAEHDRHHEDLRIREDARLEKLAWEERREPVRQALGLLLCDCTLLGGWSLYRAFWHVSYGLGWDTAVNCGTVLVCGFRLLRLFHRMRQHDEHEKQIKELGK